MLIGIDDDKVINGVESLQEEQIQSIVQTYITPNVLVTLNLISVKDAGFKTVGAIKITPTKKPHYVARAIERLKKDDSFVRRGSTTSTLNHHDLTMMIEASGKLKSESKEYSEAGEKHFSLGNYSLAIKAFSKAIELTPAPKLFFRRAIAYQNHLEERMEKDGPPIRIEDELNGLKYSRNKDFKDAIALAETPEFELEVREARYFSSYNFERTKSLGYTKDEAYEDFIVIKDSLSGNEKAEWIIHQIDEVLIEWDERALNELEDLLNSGYQTTRLYRLLIQLHSEIMFNYGIALGLVNEALEKFKGDESAVHRFLSEKLKLLLQMKKYGEAVNVINKLKRMGKTPTLLSIDLDENDLLIRIALRHGMKYREVSNG